MLLGCLIFDCAIIVPDSSSLADALISTTAQSRSDALHGVGFLSFLLLHQKSQSLVPETMEVEVEFWF